MIRIIVRVESEGDVEHYRLLLLLLLLVHSSNRIVDIIRNWFYRITKCIHVDGVVVIVVVIVIIIDQIIVVVVVGTEMIR